MKKTHCRRKRGVWEREFLSLYVSWALDLPGLMTAMGFTPGATCWVSSESVVASVYVCWSWLNHILTPAPSVPPSLFCLWGLLLFLRRLTIASVQYTVQFIYPWFNQFVKFGYCVQRPGRKKAVINFGKKVHSISYSNCSCVTEKIKVIMHKEIWSNERQHC